MRETSGPSAGGPSATATDRTLGNGDSLENGMRGLLIGIGIGLAVWAAAVIVLVSLGRARQARELATLIPNLLTLFRGLLKDPRVPRSAKVWLGVAVVWIASPIDLIPEFIPVAGPLDDAIVAALVLRHLLRTTPRAVLFEHWRGRRETLEALAGERSPPQSAG